MKRASAHCSHVVLDTSRQRTTALAAARGIVRPSMNTMWSCPNASGASRARIRGTRAAPVIVWRCFGAAHSLVALFSSLESFARTLGPVEFVARDRYVLFRSRRIFADLVVMTDALRVAVPSRSAIDNPIFFKVGADRKHVSHVAMLRDERGLSALKPYLREAYEFSIPDRAG